MPINEYGFLGKEIEIVRAEISEKYDELQNYYKEINHFFQTLKFNLTPKESDYREIYIVSLFNRALEIFQSIYILCSYGLIVDAEILNRSLYENIVKILYSSKGEDNLNKCISTDMRNSIKSIKIIKSNPKAFPKEIYGEDELDSKKVEFETLLKEIGNPKKVTIKQMAYDTGMVDMHDSFYGVASQSVHTSTGVLADYIAYNEMGNMVMMWGPRIKKIDVQLFASIELMLCSCECLREMFGIPEKEKIMFLNKQKEDIYFKCEERR